jgi:hypothetical protein
MRGYELIYPSSDKQRNLKYEQQIQKANEIWDEFTTGKRNRKQQLNEVISKKVTKMVNTIQN